MILSSIAPTLFVDTFEKKAEFVNHELSGASDHKWVLFIDQSSVIHSILKAPTVRSYMHWKYSQSSNKTDKLLLVIYADKRHSAINQIANFQT